ncbi:ABC transporter permease [Murimonas intestini]|uniref:Osmoprotectant transport system permease protein n=1 Tax=Murimonas intestini TaxID=1337051 RepID=A0AB73T9Y8_9FIRM|nr:ABC transporter permease [Murimonas intestini]MCR1839088.1 ABC transporter permease [Murimonas intestini]MCR1864384.1 ABC transporter permease [Murimonas intestini]MCR1881994.1 ABC transporter permease [Murimonas intestini]
MIEYFIKYHAKLTKALLEHIQIVGLTLVISIVIAMAVTLVIKDSKRISKAVLQVCNVIYSIPSLALFAILIPLSGLGAKTAVIVLVVYNQYILVRGFTEGLSMVDRAVLEAAAGMGMSRWQIFARVQFPLALDSMVASIQIAIISTIGIATIGATIGAGGLGSILFDGMRTQNTVKILWGTVLSVLLVLVANAILNYAVKKINERLHGGKKRP